MMSEFHLAASIVNVITNTCVFSFFSSVKKVYIKLSFVSCDVLNLMVDLTQDPICGTTKGPPSEKRTLIIWQCYTRK